MGLAFEAAATPAGRSVPLHLRGVHELLVRRKAVVYAFLASRLALLAIGLMTQIFIEPLSSQTSPLQLSDIAALRMWGQWDTRWYMELAAEGYARQPGPDGQVNWVFFPAFPMLTAALAQVTGLRLFPSMLILANLSFLAALFVVHRYAEEEFDPRVADLTVVLICAAPGSYVFSSGYTESLFLLALATSLLLLRQKRWIAAGAAAAVAVLTRNMGVALGLALATAAAPGLWRMWREAAADGGPARRRLLSEALRVGAGLALPGLAVLGFCLLLYLVAGDPLAFVHGQQAYGRRLVLPVLRVISPLVSGRLPDGDVINYGAVWLSFGLLAALAFMRRWPLLVLAAFMTLIPLASGLTSYARYCLVVLPLFLAGAQLLARRPTAAGAVLIVFATLNGFMMAAWTLGLWLVV